MTQKIFYLRTPFLAAQRFVGIAASNCIMIDREEFKKLKNTYGDDCQIIFDIDYTDLAIQVREKRSITVGELQLLLDSKLAKVRYNQSSNHYGINLSRLNCKLLENRL